MHLIKFVFSATMLVVALLSGINPVMAAPAVEQQEVSFWSEGVRLKGNLFKPENLAADQRLPGILLVHGWGGTKAHLNKAYAPQFAELGFIVMTFDFKGWGDSNGPFQIDDTLPGAEETAELSASGKHIRQVINPLSMTEDARAALNYLAGEPQVMANNIGIWGTSLGGGIALVTAAQDDRIKAYVDQIGAVNFKANLGMINDRMVRRWEVQRARGQIASYPGAESIINPALKGYPDWIYLKRFDSFAAADKLNVPSLIIDAEDEELFPREQNGQLLYAKIKDKVPAKYLAYPGKHYDIYRGEAYQSALAEARQWFVEHLKDDHQGLALYKHHCATCHANPASKAPPLGTLKKMGYQNIFNTISTGTMQVQAAAMNDAERHTLSKYLSQDSKDPRAWEASVACDSAGGQSSSLVSVSDWGYGAHNHRYQNAANAGITSDDLRQLEVAWAMGFPGTTNMRSQPVISDDTIYVGISGTSAVYAFDLASGCLKWTYRSNTPVRSSLGYGILPNGKQILFFGDARANVHIIRAADGSSVWRRDVSITDSNTITGTPVLHDKRLYVPVSSFEVSRASVGSYECCSNHGGVVALDIQSGATLWQYETTAKAEATGKNSIGVPSWGPSGAPVWTTPAIDAKRNVLYIGSGENYSQPTTNTSDAIIALDLDNGEPTWVFQATTGDAYNEACASFLGLPDQANCPENSGPDFDFGASVIIAHNRAGKDILLAGQKSGTVYALDPDQQGKVLWQTALSQGTPVGGVHWGMSLAGETLFVPIADPEWNIASWDYQPKPGVAALDINNGTIKWRHQAQRDCEFDRAKLQTVAGRQAESWPECSFFYGHSAAALAIDGAVLSGALDGKLKALDSKTGELIWQFDTNKVFDTLNGIEARGGALDNASIAVGSGRLVLQSGYNYFSQMPGNVLLVLKKP